LNTDSFRSGCNGWVNLCVERLEGWREEHGGGWVKKKEAGGSRGDLGRRGSRWGAIGDVPFVRFRSPSRIDASEREKPREERRQRERIAARKSVLHWRSQSNRVIETVHGAVSGPFLSCLFFLPVFPAVAKFVFSARSISHDRRDARNFSGGQTRRKKESKIPHVFFYV